MELPMHGAAGASPARNQTASLLRFVPRHS
jgi:hypothetical protein